MKHIISRKTISLPKWTSAVLHQKKKYDFTTRKGRLRFTIELAKLNILHGTGGPFGAAVFDLEHFELMSIGVNRVVPESFSSGHAEIIALTLAQKLLKTYDLGNSKSPPMELVSSAQPCTMCTGAILWSGVRSLLYGADSKDVEKLTGFDEGPIHPDWKNELKRRGLQVKGPRQKKEANAVLKEYKQSGIIYNSRQS